MLHAILQGLNNLKVGLFFIPVFVFLLNSCTLFQSDIETVTDLLPRDSDLSGWIRASAPADYKGADAGLYNKEYYKTGIKHLTSCSYKSTGENRAEITMEVLRFDSVLNSYGLFSRIAGEREFSNETVNSLYTDKIALALRGEYIIYAFTDSADEDMETILNFFTTVSLKYLGTNYSREKLSGTINVLKSRDRYGIIYSESGSEQPVDIDRIYYTSWQYDRAIAEVFISERESFSDSYRIFRSRLKNGYTLSESGAVHTAFKKNRDGTLTYISVFEKWIYGCSSVPDLETGKKVSEEIHSRLVQYRNN